MTIALHYSFFIVGGIERVIAFQVGLFKANHRVFLLLDREIQEDARKLLPDDLQIVVLPADRKSRNGKLRELLLGSGVNIFYEHASQMIMDINSPAFQDMLFVHDELKVRYMLHWHSKATLPFVDVVPPASASLLRSEFAPRIEALSVLGRATEAYFKAFGINANYVPNAVSFESKPIDEPASKESILWIGRMSSEKHPHDAVRIFARLQAYRPSARMTMVGGGDLLDSVKSLASRLGVKDSVTFTGTRFDLDAFYGKSAVVLATSDGEGFGVAFLEAMSYGLPMVSYALLYNEPNRDNPGMLQVPIGDIEGAAKALNQVMGDSNRWRKMSAAALERFKDFQGFDQTTYYSQLLAGKLPQPQQEYTVDDVRAILQMVFDDWVFREKKLFGSLKFIKPFLFLCVVLNTVSRIFCRTKTQKSAWRIRKRTLKLLCAAVK